MPPSGVFWVDSSLITLGDAAGCTYLLAETYDADTEKVNPGICMCSSRELPLGFQSHFRISSLCEYGRIPFQYKQSVYCDDDDKYAPEQTPPHTRTA